MISVNNASSLRLKSRRQNDPFLIGALAGQRVKVKRCVKDHGRLFSRQELTGLRANPTCKQPQGSWQKTTLTFSPDHWKLLQDEDDLKS